jgi:hypothetical protein
VAELLDIDPAISAQIARAQSSPCRSANAAYPLDAGISKIFKPAKIATTPGRAPRKPQ